MDEISNIVIKRKDITNKLLSFMGKPQDMTLPCLFLYGHTCTGKSLLIETIMDTYQAPHAILDCIECFTPRLLYETCLESLYSYSSRTQIGGGDGKAREPTNCENFNEFVRLLKITVKDLSYSDSTVYLIYDHCERLRNMDANVLPALLKLQELSGYLNICTVFISEIVFEKFRDPNGFLEPMRLHFLDYNIDELLAIMTLDCPEEYETSFYTSYVKLILSVFHAVCRNLSELRHLAQLHFDKYVEPIKAGDVELVDNHKLWRKIEPVLHKALKSVYLREVSSTEYQDILNTNAKISRIHVELPFYSKYLLVASYISSYNSVKSDRKFFAKHSGKVNKRTELRTQKKLERTTNQQLGPKAFSLDRMMAIFYSIVDGKVAPSVKIYQQVSSLVTLGLLACLTNSERLNSPKYKSLVSLDFIKPISRTINFEIERYLDDFAFTF